jgi:hypothetical protein
MDEKYRFAKYFFSYILFVSSNSRAKLSLVKMLLNGWTIFLLIFILSLIYKYLTRNNGYFKDKPFPALKPSFLVGNSFRVVTGQISATDYGIEVYNKMPNAK